MRPKCAASAAIYSRQIFDIFNETLVREMMVENLNSIFLKLISRLGM